MIEIAREKQNTFSPNFFGRIGMFWTDPETSDGIMFQFVQRY